MEETIDCKLIADDNNPEHTEGLTTNNETETADTAEVDVSRANARSNSDSMDNAIEEDRTTKTKRPPRSERKRQHYQEMLIERRENRQRKKMERKKRMNKEKTNSEDEDTERLSKRDLKLQMRRRLQDAMLTGQKICIDCSLEDFMSEKEKGKLAMQIGRLYGANRKAARPAHVYLTGLDPEKSLHRECVKKNDGFQQYLMDVKQETHTELFPLGKIVYLSPDSENLLGDIDPDKIYIIGGLVDESVTKNITKKKAQDAGISTARLPIDEHMDRLEPNTYSRVLTLNQVFEIILTYISTRDWSQALAAGVPRRKGFVPKDLSKT